MQQRILKIVENKKLSDDIYRMRLAGDVSAVTCLLYTSPSPRD